MMICFSEKETPTGCRVDEVTSQFSPEIQDIFNRVNEQMEEEKD
jgi:hypothetical protein